MKRSISFILVLPLVKRYITRFENQVYIAEQIAFIKIKRQTILYSTEVHAYTK